MVMRNVLQQAVFILLLMLAIPGFAATATVDRDRISLDETVTLTISVESASIFGEPDLSKLEQDFHVLNTSRRTQIVNGAASTQWIIPLSPRHEGKLKIPSLKVSGERSPPIFIEVTAQTQSAVANDTRQSLWISVETEQPSVYVQQQAIVTVRIGTAVDLLEAPSVQKPDIPNVVFEVLNSTQYIKRINGTRYTIFEIKCAFFPDQSGTLVIPPFMAHAVVPQQVRQNSSLFFQRFLHQGRRVQLKSKPIDLDIREKPATFPANAVWLPAQSLSATEAWSADPQSLAAGGSITRSITLQARGSLGEQLPPLPTFSLDGFKLYPDQAKTDKQLEADTVTGTRVESIAMLPTRPGDFMLPEIRIPWWNTQTDRLEYAVVPAITLKVQGAPLVTVPAPQPIAPSQPSQSAPQNAGPAATTIPAVNASATGYWPWICAALAGGWSLTALLWWLSQRRHRVGTVTDDQTDHRENAAWNAVTSACSSADPHAVRTALLALARVWFSGQRHAGLEAFAVAGDAKLTTQLRLLDQQLYSSQRETAGFDAKSLLQSLRALRQSRSGKQAADEFLPPLYPHAS